MSQPLVIHDDLTTLDAWVDALHRTLDGARPGFARHLKSAREILARNPADWSLVVLPANARRDELARGGRGTQAAAEFVEHLERTYPDIPVIVVAEKGRTLLRKLGAIPPKMQLIELPDLSLDLLCERAFAMVAGDRPPENELDIEIRVMDQRTCWWSMRMRGGIDAKVWDAKILALDPRKFDAVRRMATPQVDADFVDWSNELSSKVHDLLFFGESDHDTFRDHFLDSTARVDPQHRHVRIRSFTQEHHDMHFDMLKRMSDDEQPMMLSSPVVRQHGAKRTTRPLFNPKERIRCLVVLARNADWERPDSQESRPDDLTALAAARAEADDVTRALRMDALRPDSCISADPADVRLLTFEQGEDPCRKLSAVLSENEPWHLIHFVGHGQVVPIPGSDPPRNRGELILCSRDRISIDFSELARQLAHGDTRLLFLGACQTGRGLFLSTAAEQIELAAVIGYRWRVADDRALDFARAFYAALLEQPQASRHAVERAFVAARSAVYKMRPGDCTWASPALLHQLDS